MKDKQTKNYLDSSRLSLRKQVKKEEEEEKTVHPKPTKDVPPLPPLPPPTLPTDAATGPLPKRARIKKDGTKFDEHSSGASSHPDCSKKSVPNCPLALQWEHSLLGNKGSIGNSPLTAGSVSLPLGQYPSGRYHTDGQLGEIPSGRFSLTGSGGASVPLPVYNNVQSGNISQGISRTELANTSSIKLSRLINTPRTPATVRRSIFDKAKDRKERDSARKKIKREEETPEKRRDRLDKVKIHQQIKREEETPEKRRERLDKVKTHQRIKREEETPEKRREQLDKDKTRKQIKREEETPEIRRDRLNKVKARKQIKCEEETPEKRQGRLSKDKSHKQIKREHETPNERKERQVKDADSKRIKREAETPVQRRLRLQQACNPRFGSAVCRRRHVDENGYTWGCASEFAGHWPQYMKMRVFGRDKDTAPKICPFCKAFLFDDEDYNHCCSYGAIQVEPLPDAPELIQHLCDHTVKTPEAVNFRKEIVSYNTGLAFGSLSTEREMPQGQGPPVMKMNGKISQQIGNLRPGMNEQGQRKDPLFGQVYMLDDLNAAIDTRMRTSHSNDLSRSMMTTLEKLIRHCNPFAQRLLSLGRQLEAAERGQQTNLPPVERFRLSILDSRPSPNQVCALFDSLNNDPPDSNLCGIWLLTDGNHLVRIGIHNRNADWIQFPIMFPYATQTYGRGIPISSHPPDPEAVIELDDTELLNMLESNNALPGAVDQNNSTQNQLALESPPQLTLDENHQTEEAGAVPPTIPAIEPSNWDDDIEVVDVEIPQNIQQIITVEDGEEVTPVAVTQAWAPHDRDGYRHFRRYPRNLRYVEYRVPLPAEYLQNHPHIIRDRTNLRWETLIDLMVDNRAWADDRQIWASMARVALLHPGRIAVLDPMFTSNARWMAEEGNVLDHLTYTLGETNAPDIIAIPVYMPNHWVLGIFEKRNNTIHYFDSFNNPISLEVHQDLLDAVRRFYPLGVRGEDGNMYPPVVHEVPYNRYNRQEDGINCGFHVCLIWESWLTSPNQTTLIPYLSLPHERQRILANLISVFCGDDLDFLPLSRAIQPPLQEYLTTLPYQELIRDVRDAMLHGTAVGRDCQNQDKSTQPASVAPAIGPFVPYHTDVDIPPARIDESMLPDDEEDADDVEGTEPFIASGRVRDSIKPYCPRQRGKAKFLSRRKWLKPHLRRRRAIMKHHPLLSYGKLTQMYLIRQSWLIFADEEDYQRRLQNAPQFRRTIRSELIAYHERNLRRHNANDPNVEQQKIGRVYRMPKTSRQSEQNTSMNITKAMALRKKINPNCGMFVTFTFNCKCPEIVEMCGSGSNPADYPDLCCELATAKFKQLLSLLSGPNGVLGPVKGWCWSLEYQKRGNKHYHLVLMNDPDDPIDPNTPEYVDQYITAKIPDMPVIGDPDYDAKKAYYDLVTQLYIHTCEDNEEAACRVGRPNNDCRFGFPQPYCEYTTFNEHNSTVTYARPSPEQGGNSFIKQGANGKRKIIDNRYVVPHNRALTLAMGCHICVKFISKFDIWFYLFKYSYKLDKKVMAALYVQDPNDPNVYHADAFNVRRALTFQGPFEAYDILTSARWVGRSHDVTLLSIHLEDQEPVFFIAGSEESAERRVTDPNFRSRYTAYHQLCREDEEARQLRFDQIEEFFTFHARDPHTGKYIWQYMPRLRGARGGMFVCMIYPPNPHNRELFATYLLTIELRGVQGFEDLRSLNRPSDSNYDPSQPTAVCPNAIEACVRRGLLTDDSTWQQIMQQVSCSIHNSRQFVRFFVTMLVHSQPSNPRALLDEYVDRLLSPPQQGRANDRHIRYQQMLRQMQWQLEEHGRSLSDFGLPEPEPDNLLVDERVNADLIPPVYDETGEPVEMTTEERTARAEQIYQSCNAGQRAFVDLVFTRLEELESDPHNRELSNIILLQGEGGTGKTHALNSLIEKCHALGIPIGVCASTGIAATHLLGGRTAHSLFGIPVKKDSAPESTVRFSYVNADSYKGRLLKKYRIIIVDEAGMSHVDDIYTINMLLKDLHDTSTRFGRVLMIFTGDERQIMPIVKGVDPLSDRQADASFFFSHDCRISTRVVLTENMRVQEGQENFLTLQRNIGSDRYQHVKFPHDTRNRLTRYICVPRQFVRYTEDAFIRDIFNAEVFAGDPMLLTRRVILAPHNTTVNTINDRVASLMPADRPSHTYLSTNIPDAYDVYDPTTVIFSNENLQSISSSDLPDHSLTLIVGMPVMCMQNLDVPNGICNGTVMIVERLDSVVAWCRVNTRHGQRLVPIIPMRFVYSSNGFKFTRIQMPLRRAFCVTNNRSQGGTYDVVGYHALRPIWAHGMLYTAITRVTSAAGFSILCPPHLLYHHPGRDEMFATTRNVVHPRVSGRTETVTAEPPTQPTGEQHVVDEQDMDFGPEFESYNR